MRGLEPLSPAVFDGWNGLLEGAIAVHDRFCAGGYRAGRRRRRRNRVAHSSAMAAKPS